MDFYCDQIPTGTTLIERVAETADVLAFHHGSRLRDEHGEPIPQAHL